MNGAESMLETLIANGVEVCFTNPGTSEMHMVAAIGRTEGMRSILSLFEGVCTGAADGYGRMTGKPACTLLHLGPGLSNGSANLHNARKANTPVINLIGDHATDHKRLDAPLTSDIIGLSHPVSHWVRTVRDAQSLPRDAAEAVAAANAAPGQISTLIIPADCAWNESVEPVGARALPGALIADETQISRASTLLANDKPTVILLSNLALSEKSLEMADRIAQAADCRVFCDTFTPRLPRGEGRPTIERLGYFAEQATVQLAEAQQMIMVGTKAPVGFFAYPDKPSEFFPEGCELHTLAGVGEDAEDALTRLADSLGALDLQPRRAPLNRPTVEDGELGPGCIARVIGANLPEHAVVVDEGATAGGATYPATANAPAHDWLSLTGGSIGFGLPCAVGAAVACPDRKVIALHGDGGAMYTVQALWTMVRENLDICVVILSNHKYQILQIELARVGAQSMNKKTLDMLDLTNPTLDFVKMGEGLGMPSTRAGTTAEFAAQFEAAMAATGPRLIEVELGA